jgi:pilus assembly protein CpaF
MRTVLGETAPTLDDLVQDPSLEEVWINGPDQVFVAGSGVSRAVPISLSAIEIRGFVERVLRQTGRRVDVSSPFVDASLPDGSRLHVVIPDITKAHWSVNIRKFSQSLRGLGDLMGVGVLSLEAADYLGDAVAAGKSVLVSGATQAGKTTMLMALLDAIPHSERIVTVEETFELALHRPDHVGMQCRGKALRERGRSLFADWSRG